MELRTHEGDLGNAYELASDTPGAEATVAHWLVTLPCRICPGVPVHHYILAAVTLQVVPGFKEPAKMSAHVTHEFLVVPLIDEEGPYTREVLDARYGPGAPRDGLLPFHPPTVVAQMTATDTEVSELVKLVAAFTADGRINPEDGMAWGQVLATTMDHLRGHHA